MRWHSADDASRLAALLLPRILPIFSVVAPGQPGASPPSVLRRIYEMSSSGLSTLIGALVALMVIRLFRGAQKGPDRWTPRGEPIDLTSHRRPTDALVYLLAVDGNVNPRGSLNSDRWNAGCQAFAEAFVRDAGTRRTRRAHTRNGPIVRAASRPRSRSANRSGDDRTPDSAAQVQEPQGSASLLLIASGAFGDPCGVRGRPHSRR